MTICMQKGYLAVSTIFSPSHLKVPFPLTVLNFLQFVDCKDSEKFKAEYLSTKSQNRHFLLKTDLRRPVANYLQSSQRFIEQFPEGLLLESSAADKFVVGLKIYDTRLMDSWYLRAFVNGRDSMLDFLIRDKRLKEGMEVIKTFSLLLTSD